jgi:glyoxylase-like metal-dependent hydrolase (beta-lactamase superfamily II)
MQTQTIGDIVVRAIHEKTEPTMPPAEIMSQATPDAIAPHMDWLAPTFLDPATGALILTFQSFVVQTPRHTILIDTCIGNDKERANPEFHMQTGPWLDNLKTLGLAPEDIDFVMCTHLHPDHVGWNTQLRDGRWVPTFPNARYVFARDEYAYWEAESAAGSERIGLTFDDSVLPVMEAGQAVLVDHDHQIEDGIWLEPTPGHSPGHVVVHAESGGGHGVFVGDLMHHPLQVPHPDWSTCWCWDLEMSAQSRTRFVEQHTDAGTLILPVHFAGPTAGRIVSDGASQRFAFVDG